MRTTPNGLKFIAAREALVLVAYQDGKHMSIGFGSNDPRLKEGDKITVKEAFARLRADVEKRDPLLEKLIKRDMAPHQWDALMSLYFQSGNRYAPAVVHLWNAKQDQTMFELWLLSDRDVAQQRLQGLHKRRTAEVKLFQEGNYGPLATIPMWRGNPRKTKREEYTLRPEDLG